MGKTGEFRTLRAMNVIAVWLEQFEQWLSLFNKLTLEQVEDINSSVYIIPSYYSSSFFFFKQIMACDFIKPKYLKWSKSLRTVWVVRLCFLWSLLSQQTKRWLLTSMSHSTLVVSTVWLWYNLLTAKKTHEELPRPAFTQVQRYMAKRFFLVHVTPVCWAVKHRTNYT